MAHAYKYVYEGIFITDDLQHIALFKSLFYDFMLKCLDPHADEWQWQWK